MGQPKTNNRKKANAAKDKRAVRVYVALLKTTDPYDGSKIQGEHKKGGKR